MPTFTLVLTGEELNLLGSALSDRPFKEVAGLLGKINQQILKQNTPPPQEPPAPAAPALPEAPAGE